MNHIARLTTERLDAIEQLGAARALLEELEAYLLSSKFAGPDNDYVHVRTDMLPKLAQVRSALITA
jgi:ATP-dependent RNA circularization protein (DNA/RNA ligase family)